MSPPPLDPLAPIGPGGPLGPPPDPGFAATNDAFERLTRDNVGASLTVARGGAIVLSRAAGASLDGRPATGDTPMVVASVSKLVVAVAIARLTDLGRLSTADVVPWGDIGLVPHDAWRDVTIRELLDHTSGVPKARSTWFTGKGDCRTHVQSLVADPPRSHRGTWVYSNGNYCLLGLIVEQRTGISLDDAVQRLVFDPVGAEGVHLTDDGLLPTDMPHPQPDGVGRLSRLGGSGNLIVSTDDLALAIDRLTAADLAVLRPPGVFTDQYGFGHTGTVEGARACIWVLEGGSTVVAATVAGDSPFSGGAVCDVVVPAVATDLGIAAGPPDRAP